MRKKVLVAVADGVEEIEAITPVDVLRRVGAEVILAAISKLEITASRGTKLIADKLLAECKNEIFDLIIVPGGMPGAEHLRDSALLIDMLKKQKAEGRLYSAICAAPVVVLQHHGLLEELKATCHPSMFSQLKNLDQAMVVVDGNCVTSQGPGTAMEFSIRLAELLFDKEKAGQIKKSIVF